MPLEKDFSPTLAGSDRAAQRTSVIEWIRRVPGLIRAAAKSPDQLRVGLKLFNSLEDDEFQQQLLAEVHQSPDRPDFAVYANRLFDPDRVFEGNRGVAYGGPRLSNRNLRTLSSLRLGQERGAIPRVPLELSGTGDISLRTHRRRICAPRMHQLSDSHPVSAPRVRICHAQGLEGPAGLASPLLRPSRRLHRLGTACSRTVGLGSSRWSRSLSRPCPPRRSIRPHQSRPRRPFHVGRRRDSACRHIAHPATRPFEHPERSRPCHR